MTERLDAVVVLAGDFSEDRTEIGPGSTERMNAAMEAVTSRDVPHLVVAGSHPFVWRNGPKRPLADLMKGYAVDNGLPEDMVHVQARSLDTIGDAVCTKTDIIEPNGWLNFALVTSNSHLPRGEHIFGHVMGPDYTIEGIPSGEAAAVKNQKLQEMVGGLLVRAVLSGTEAGDTLAIQRRLFRIIPGYDDVSATKRILTLAQGLVVG